MTGSSGWRVSVGQRVGHGSGYVLRVTTDEAPQRLDLRHTNIRLHGTIFNTLAAVCEVTGEIYADPIGVV